jgi:nucleoside 2-deoxyribosyltransferase
MLIYVAGPYTAETPEGVEANIRAAEEIGKEVLLRGFVPVVPHAMTGRGTWEQALPDWSHEDWLFNFCFPLIRHCDALLLMPEWESSRGAVMELHYAREKRKPVFYGLEELPGMEG